MPTYLEQWNDPTVKVDMKFDWHNYALEQGQRLARLHIIARMASEMKHRLGSDATREELAGDKKMCKRVAASAKQFSEFWAEDQDWSEYARDHHEALMREAAQIDWPRFLEENKTYIQANLRLIATTAIRTGETQTGNILANRLMNEGNTFENAWKRTLLHQEKMAKNANKRPKKS